MTPSYSWHTHPCQTFYLFISLFIHLIIYLFIYKNNTYKKIQCTTYITYNTTLHYIFVKKNDHVVSMRKHVALQSYIHVCMHACMYLCMYVCMYVCRTNQIGAIIKIKNQSNCHLESCVDRKNICLRFKLLPSLFF